MVQTPCFKPALLGLSFVVRARRLLLTGATSPLHSQILCSSKKDDGFGSFSSKPSNTQRFDRRRTRTNANQNTTPSSPQHGQRYPQSYHRRRARRGSVTERRFQRHFRLRHGTSLRHRSAALVPDSQSHRRNDRRRTHAHHVATANGSRRMHLLHRPARSYQGLASTLQALVLF